MMRLTTWLLLVVSCGLSCKKADNLILSDSEGSSNLDLSLLQVVLKEMQNGRSTGPLGDFQVYENGKVVNVRLTDLQNLTEDQAFDRMRQSIHFADAMLAYNLNFLGRGENNFKTGIPAQDTPEEFNYQYKPQVLAYPQAVASAYATARGGDFFQLLAGSPTLHIPWVESETPESLDAEVNGVDQAIYQSSLQGSAESMCGKLNGVLPRTGLDGDFGDGLNPLDGQSLPSTPLTQLVSQFAKPIIRYCKFQPDSEQVKKMINELRNTMRRFVKERKQYLKEAPARKFSLLDFQNFEAKTAQEREAMEPIGAEAWVEMPNSITNANRKRSAYVFETYLCEGIVPIDLNSIEDVKEHKKGNKHLDNPQCASCHFKLDPMAGLFRYYGPFGADYRAEPASAGMRFDGAGFMTASTFGRYLEENWPTDRNGRPDVGVYLEPGKKDPDWHGEDLKDLWPYLSRSERFKQCYVKRLAQDIFGKNQAVSESWINQLAREIQPGPDSSKGVLSVLRQLYFSKTMRVPNRTKSICYDLGPEDLEGKGIPCSIKAIVTRKCATCHQGSGNGLDVTAVTEESGKSWFKHPGVTPTESASEILARINETDRDMVMPQGNSQLTEEEKTILESWLRANGASQAKEGE